jgi:hypothetical protein
MAEPPCSESGKMMTFIVHRRTALMLTCGLAAIRDMRVATVLIVSSE